MRSFLFYLTIIPLLGIALSCGNKETSIEGHISGIEDSDVFLLSYEGKSVTRVDSTRSKNGKFKFMMSPELKHGMYHVHWGPQPHEGIDFVWNYENFSFTAHNDSIGQTLTFNNSPENDLFYAFYPIKLTITQLTAMGDHLNKTDPMGNRNKLIDLNNYLDSLEFAVHQLLDDLDEDSKKLFSYKVLKAAFFPNYDYFYDKGKVTKMDPLVFMHFYFFENIDFNEPGLIRTPFLFFAIEEYLSLYVSPPTSEQFQKASDMIISKAAVNDEMYEYVTSLLVKTFESSDFWEVYLYIMETYQSEVCSDHDAYGDKGKLYEIVSNSKPGSPAPDFSGVTTEGKPSSFHEVFSPTGYVLLFWDPDCAPCEFLIAQMSAFMPQYRQKGVEVVAFGLTKDKEEWLDAIDKHKMKDWVNLTDLKDTESPLFDKYHIRGTPEMYVVTKDFEIFSRPSNYIELDKDLARLMGGR